MPEHIWRWHSTHLNPHGWVYDGDGWYVCLRCGVSDYVRPPARCAGFVGIADAPDQSPLAIAALHQVREAERRWEDDDSA